ncbi:uncharacterized protein DDB_G0271670-like [Zingiber officinale]|uniref:Membrane-associated kinase regulator 6 n=1 Tax=Zingiber officinale TaxID=94328 RepID=A0A8J5GZU0_ZINOF|nr:uncharacterized protein DDB_G0271670-like [Zingiber officinale]KAG6513651.1 hypothetical protein ZIOFF_023984 [Zingiber officinale]
MAMEVAEQFSDDSFSYSWSMTIDSSAVDPSASHASLDRRDGTGALIDVDPFDFDVLPLAGEPCAAPALVHADQIIADGRLLPLVHLPKRSTVGSSPSETPVLLRSPSVDSSDSLASRSNRSLSCRSYMEIGRSSNSSTLGSNPSSSSSSSSSSTSGSGRSSREKKALRYLCFLQPFYKTRRSSGKTWSSSWLPRKSGDAISGSHRSNMTAADVDTETAIHEAVLHCKNSLGKL